jgi:hypothetical protein
MNIQDTKITIFSNVRSNAATYVTIGETLEAMRSQFESEITNVRTLSGDDYTKAKTKLPAITWCGTFDGGHKLSNLTHYNNILCADLDHLPNPQETKEILKKDPCVYSVFLSPGGNGLKVIIPFGDMIDLSHYSVDELDAYHKKQFGVVMEYFQNTYGLLIHRVKTYHASVSYLMILIFISPQKQRHYLWHVILALHY